ncbi:MAG TPA: MBL fold metallo-hydrolase [Caulobacterales bacterium]|nr:MBL fold metallo-hydrolase [Caulobacterales bacterium]
MSTLRVTILGCGSSGGVPRASGFWGACDPNEPRNRRSRCGLLLQLWRGEAGAAEEATSVLIDTPPDLREQLARVRPHHIDAVLYSHDHADQTHGIDDLRAFFIERRKRIPVYMDSPTRALLVPRFYYCFHGVGGYPAILDDQGDLTPHVLVQIDGPGGVLTAEPLAQDHGGSISLGFRIGPIAYSNDVVALPESTMAALHGLDLWIVDALREAPHPTHAHLALSLEWIAKLKPKHAVLTNLHLDLDYNALKARLPAGIEPAYDGWSADFSL